MCTAACGRWGFGETSRPSDALGDGVDADAIDGPVDAMADAAGTSGVFVEIMLPPGGRFDGYEISGDGTVRYVLAKAQRVYRSTNGSTWTPCARLEGGAISIGPSNVVYLATGTDVYSSNDSCATWTPMGLGAANDVLATTDSVLAATDQGLRQYANGTWMVWNTPAEGSGVTSIARNASGDLVVGTYTGAIYKSGMSATWQVSTGLPGVRVDRVAIGLDQGGITPAYATSTPMNELDCSADGGATFAQCSTLVATSLLPSGTSRDALLAGLYDDMVSSPDRMASVVVGLRTAIVHQGWVYGIIATPSGGTAIATSTGVYEAVSGGYNWEDANTGLDAWSIDRIRVTPGVTYLALDMGLMRTATGGTFAMATSGMTHNSQVFDVVDAGGTLLAGGRYIRVSSNGGDTWTEVFDTNNDGFRATSFAMSGTTAYAGTWTRVLSSTPPYTSWTPHTVAAAARKVYDVAMRDSTLYAAAENGVFTSSDGAVTWTQIATLPSLTARRIRVMPDGRVVVGIDNGVWISNQAATTWTQHLNGEAIEDVASDGTAIAAVEGGTVKISHDGGATWTELVGLVGRHPRAAEFDTAGGLLVGCDHNSLWRAPSP